MNRELLQLAKVYEPAKHQIGGWYLSEKLDGTRAVWIPETRGLGVEEVGFANTQKGKRLWTATGLWSRYGNVIAAPDWWLDELPSVVLDGELYTERGDFQNLRSIISRKEPGDGWRNVRFLIFDGPGDKFLEPGRINNPNLQLARAEFGAYKLLGGQTFRTTLERLQGLEGGDWWSVHQQERLPLSETEARETVIQRLAEVCDAGGEGLILRKPDSVYIPKRVNTVLKVKKLLDSEGVVVGWTGGEGKYEGMMGSLIVSWRDKLISLSGFTDEERRVEESVEPGGIGSEGCYFKMGETVEFWYVGLTDDGFPKEARFKRH